MKNGLPNPAQLNRTATARKRHHDCGNLPMLEAPSSSSLTRRSRNQTGTDSLTVAVRLVGRNLEGGWGDEQCRRGSKNACDSSIVLFDANQLLLYLARYSGFSGSDIHIDLGSNPEFRKIDARLD